MLNRLLYTSRCAFSSTGDALVSDVRELARLSAERNAKAQLTGALIHVRGSFVQVLEGPAAALEQTFERICCDFRHDEMKLVDVAPIQSRAFAGWELALLSAEQETALSLREDLDEIRFLIGINAREAISLMRRVLREQTAVA
jgi:hypothetical protein